MKRARRRRLGRAARRRMKSKRWSRKRLTSKRMNMMSSMSVRISSRRCPSKSSKKARKRPGRRSPVAPP